MQMQEEQTDAKLHKPAKVFNLRILLYGACDKRTHPANG